MKETEIIFPHDAPIPEDKNGNVYSHALMNDESIFEAIDAELANHKLELLVGDAGSNVYNGKGNSMKIFLISACIILWILNIFDCISTYILLQNGGIELNLFVNWFMNLIGIVEAMLLLKIPFLILLTYVVICGLKKTLVKREIIFLSTGYIFLISFYSFYMYKYNLASLLNIV